MTEEIKTEIETKEEKTEEKKCCCECLKKFLLTSLAAFFGCLVALCLYSAATRPQFPPPPMMKGPHQMRPFEHGRFDRHQASPPEMKGQRPEKKFDKKGGFKDEKWKKDFDNDFPFQRPDFGEEKD